MLRLSVDVVCAYVANNQIDAAELPQLISRIHESFRKLAQTPEDQERAGRPAPLTPAQIRKSVTPDYIICFENGRPYRSLTRHLRAAYGLTPAEYRAKWGLPPDYPMVAPNYAAMRSQLARNIGLGSGGKTGG
ncbi:MucR family transcriptional regulator [Camelimonas abortus]|uniref:MucR family transcriptional regulator n=1 Tax=Camelimonas abortus TaxID=1017184 RepID=A0ABV7LGB5_9HYPH